MKPRQVVEELFHVDKKLTDGQTDITMLIVRFSIFMNTPKVFNEFY